MDATEKHVMNHLMHRGCTNVVYEPDGNVPPDFLVDGSIAIEVRRLNQHHFDGADTKGLEEVAIPLWHRVKKLITELGPPIGGESWFIFLRFKRPMESWRTLEPRIQKGLQSFMQSATKQKGSVVKGKGFELDVFRASKQHATMFVMGGCRDRDSGGWVVSEMETNIRYCASVKSRKIANVRSKYGHWWLALVDHIGQGLDSFEREAFRNQVSIEHSWDKILIIDPSDHTRWFEI